MRTISGICVGVLLAVPAMGQGTGSTVRMTPATELRSGVAGVPQIEQPSDDAQRRINDSLSKLNDSARTALNECDASVAKAQEQAKKRLGNKAVPVDSSTDWQRTVEVTMAGPRYLSVVVSDTEFCAVHPKSELMALVFDLGTGLAVDWTKLLPAGQAEMRAADEDDATGVKQVSDVALRKVYLGRMSDQECGDALKRAVPDGLLLAIWPDAKEQKMMLAAVNVPGMIQACVERVALTVDEAQKLGFPADLLQAVAGR